MDAYLLANYHKVITASAYGSDKKFWAKRFAGMLSFQLLKNAKNFGLINNFKFFARGGAAPRKNCSIRLILPV
jgi:hypothetical protein